MGSARSAHTPSTDGLIQVSQAGLAHTRLVPALLGRRSTPKEGRQRVRPLGFKTYSWFTKTRYPGERAVRLNQPSSSTVCSPVVRSTSVMEVSCAAVSEASSSATGRG